MDIATSKKIRKQVSSGDIVLSKTKRFFNSIKKPFAKSKNSVRNFITFWLHTTRD